MENKDLATFEDFKNENGITYWWASDLMRMLGYNDMRIFQKVLDRATKAFVSLGIPYYENIVPQKRGEGDNAVQDFKLTRFACYLTAMNADPKKVEVAAAQAYFVTQARRFELIVENNQQIDRLIIRDELTDGNKSLASVVKAAHVEDYAKFQNAGYRGMYNMMSYQLEKRRGLKHGHLTDTMSRTELAANLFRVTQTEERIKSQNVEGQYALEATHFEVGREVRNIVQKNMGVTPENMPQEKALPEVKKNLKVGYKEMRKIDKKR